MFDIGSIVGGIGNFLGGLFGQKKKDDPQSQPQSQPQQPRQPQQPLGIAAMPSLNIPSAQSQQAPTVQPQQLSGVTTAPKAPVAPTAPTPNFFTDAANNVGKFVGDAANNVGNAVNDFQTNPNNQARNMIDYVTGQHNPLDGATLDYQHKDAQGRPLLVPQAAPTNLTQAASQSLGGTLVNDLAIKPTLEMANVATRIPETFATAANVATGNTQGGLATTDAFNKVQNFLGGLENPTENSTLNQTASDISQGKANPGQYLQAAGDSLGLAGTLPIAKVFGGAARGVDASAVAESKLVTRDPSSPITASPATDKPAAITSPNPDHPTNAPAIAPSEAITPSAQSAGEPPVIQNQMLQAASTRGNGLEPVDTSIPAFQRRAAAQQAATTQTAQDNAFADANGIGQTSLDTRTALQHKQDIQSVINQGNQELNDFVNTHQDLNPQEIQSAKDSITSQVAANVQKLQEARYGVASEPSPVSSRVRSDGATVNTDGSVVAADGSVLPRVKQIESVEKPPVDDSIPVADSTAAKVDDTQPAGVNPDAVAQVGVGKRAFSSKENIIRATNTESGTTLADGIVKAEDGHLNYTGKAMSQLHDAFKLNKADFETAWRVQEGEIDPKTVSPAISDAANQMKQVMGDIHKSAENAGVVSGDLGDTYMPHIYV